MVQKKISIVMVIQIYHINYIFLTLRARKAFKTAIIVTPISAKIAAHIVAKPTAHKTRTIILTPIAKTIF